MTDREATFAASALIERLAEIAEHGCIYDNDAQPPPCPEEWPGEQFKWCGGCLANEVVKEARNQHGHHYAATWGQRPLKVHADQQQLIPRSGALACSDCEGRAA